MTQPDDLHLSLTARGTVLAEADPTSLPRLRRLQMGFPGAEAFGRSAFESTLGAFLGHLSALSAWQPGDVNWDEPLKRIVMRSLDDGEHLDSLRHSETQESFEVGLEPDWTGALTPFQERDLEVLVKTGHSANFSVPGAGKTRVALAYISHLRQRGEIDRAIVIAPKSAHESWAVESAASFRIPRTVVVYEGGVVPDCDILVLNYERLPGARAHIASALTGSKALLVLDEAHRMKRGEFGAFGAACLSLGPLAAYRLILSGTPAPNGLNDLRSLMEFVWPGRGARLLGAGSADWAALSRAIRPLFTRTTKSELNLPPLEVIIKRVDLPPLQRELYDALLGQLRVSVADSERMDDLGRVIVYLLMAATSPALLALGSSRYEPLQFRVPPFQAPRSGVLRSLLADLPKYEMSPKLLEAVRIARENARLGRKTVIWSTFIRNLTTLASMMPDLNPVTVIGSTSDDERRVGIDGFRHDPDTFVLLSNPSTLGEGVSLHHECHDAVYVDRDFAAGRFLQSLDRIHRLGLAAGVETRATVLIASGTIDELVEARLAAKLTWMGNALDDPGLSELADLEDERESGEVIDASDADAVWAYLGRGAPA